MWLFWQKLQKSAYVIIDSEGHKIYIFAYVIVKHR